MILQSSNKERENGIVIPLVAAMIVFILALAGLAVDAGNLYFKRLQLQKALDASVTSAAKALALIPFKDRDGINNADPSIPSLKETSDKETIVRLAAQDTIEANLYFLGNLEVGKLRDILSKPTGPRGFLKIDDGVRDLISARVEIDVPLLIMKFVPGIMEKSKKISVASKVQVERAMVAMVMDYSGSMICPADESVDCALCIEHLDCRSYGYLKIDYLKLAVEELLTILNYERDLVQLTSFAKGATTSLKMSLSPPGVNLGDALNRLDYTALAGATNPTAGLIAAYDSSRSIVTQMQRGNIAYVVFTDGAPNAARFNFASPKAGADFGPLNYRQRGPTDIYSWWITERYGTTPYPTEMIKGEIPWNWSLPEPPTPYTEILLTAQNLTVLEDDWIWPEHLLPKPDDLQDSRTPCGSPVRFTNTHLVKDKDGNIIKTLVGDLTDFSQIKANPANAFNGCLQDFAFRAINGKVYGKGVPFSDYIKQYYNVFIAEADSLRDSGGIVYTIGVGLPAPDSNDPYQDAPNFDLRKDYLLSRVANDPITKTISAMNNLPSELVKYQPAKDEHLAVGEYLKLDTYDTIAFNHTFALLGDKIIRKVKSVKMIPQEWCEAGTPCD